MPMPENFKYKEVYLRGKPRHEKNDPFWIRHPPMDHVRWAKIFSPFDALEGFDECIHSKETEYMPRRDLSEGEIEDLNRKLSILHSLTCDSPTARKNRPIVTIRYFHPCMDVHSEWYGTGGFLKTIEGTCHKVDRISITVEDQVISLRDILSITGKSFDKVLSR